MSVPDAPSPTGDRFEPATPVIRGASRRFATARTVLALMLREMSTSYGRSPGGYLWAVLEPLGSIILLSLGFALIARHPPIGTNFILFYATGFLPFALFQDVSHSIARCISYSRALLAYPAVTWMDALLRDLYHATRRALLRGLDNPQAQDELIALKQHEALRLMARYGESEEACTALWLKFSLDFSY